MNKQHFHTKLYKTLISNLDESVLLINDKPFSSFVKFVLKKHEYSINNMHLEDFITDNSIIIHKIPCLLKFLINFYVDLINMDGTVCSNSFIINLVFYTYVVIIDLFIEYSYVSKNNLKDMGINILKFIDFKIATLPPSNKFNGVDDFIECF